MQRKLVVIAIIIGFFAITGFIAFEKYFGSFKSEIPGKWEVASGEGCFEQVRFFGGAGKSKTIKLYADEDGTETYNGKYSIEGDVIHAEVMDGEEEISLEMTFEQTKEKVDRVVERQLDLVYEWQGEQYTCIYKQGAE